MLHKDVLKFEFPLKDLGGVFDADTTIEGKYLDQLKTSADNLVGEFFPDSAYATITDWERVYGITPVSGDTMQRRRDVLLQRVRAAGGLSIPYFLQLALTIGITITIEEFPPNYAPHGPESIFIWNAHITGTTGAIRYFRAGDSGAGDRLTDWDPITSVESILMELKPAHTQVYFIYD